MEADDSAVGILNELVGPGFNNDLSAIIQDNFPHGFDILGQLSNVTQTLNGQGRYETWRNVIPSYAMLRLAYNLDIKPAKRRGE
jgi:hypothetical protein